MNLHLINASQNDAEQILALYKSVIGTEFCVWNESYPTQKEIEQDLKTDNLFILKKDSRVIGAISVETINDMDSFTCWDCNDGTQVEIARVVIAKDFWGQGLAEILINDLAEILIKRGCNSIHLAVAKSNLPAYKTYQKTGFILKGEADIYNGNCYIMEKILNNRSKL